MHKYILPAFLVVVILSCNTYRDHSDYLMANLTKAEVMNSFDPALMDVEALDDQLQPLREDCDWENRKGKFVDTYWLQVMDRDQDRYGYIYEYYLDCDSLRFIYWYADPKQNCLVNLQIEPIEKPTTFVTYKRKQLANDKKATSLTGQ
jgi:hypothetical protein